MLQVRSGFDLTGEKEFQTIDKYSGLICPTQY